MPHVVRTTPSCMPARIACQQAGWARTTSPMKNSRAAAARVRVAHQLTLYISVILEKVPAFRTGPASDQSTARRE
jgi:hypothetical protein